jgi:hypothetical protein
VDGEKDYQVEFTIRKESRKIDQFDERNDMGIFCKIP